MNVAILAAPDVASGDDAVLLQISGLTKRYGDDLALGNVSFPVRPGEVLGLIGPNGAGKTTLLEAVVGLLPVDGGEIRWRGRPLAAADRRQHIFYLPDGVRPWGEQFVVRVLEFFAGVHCRPNAAVAEAVAASGLGPVLGKRIDALSKGYARRMMWALALLAPHPLLLMDEPFDGFDVKQTRHMARVLRDTLAAGRAMILSIHQLAEAERVCDRFVLLAAGAVRGTGTIEELRGRAKRSAANLEEIFLALA